MKIILKFPWLAFFLARRSKKLDKKLADAYWQKLHEVTEKAVGSIDLDTSNIQFTKIKP